MNDSKQPSWLQFQKSFSCFPALDLALDLSRMNFPDGFFASMEPNIQKAFAAMHDLEAGAIANPDEKRMVGHYWLRNPALAPSATIRSEIEQTVTSIQAFAREIHSGNIKGAQGAFKNLLVVGIGGSALGPQFVANALGKPGYDKLLPYFLDNTDPDGIDKMLSLLAGQLAQTLVIVISKSGGTKETRNGMLEVEAAYTQAGLDFPKHAVAVTSTGSSLDKRAVAQGWIQRFPMWDWVGGRTSETSAVGLLPAALQGIDIAELLAGAKACDEQTRIPCVKDNPAAQLALTWFSAGSGHGAKNMVVLPYKDRLELFSKYLQQLIMESLGKKLDLDGKIVHQGITVLGNKGATDQHSYIQQLRDGLDNFFVTFIEVLQDRKGKALEVEPGVTSGDYLEGFYLGTRSALYESNRCSITLTVKEVSPAVVGMLIALFERTVGLYSVLINVNAYHQPGVEAGKKAATGVIDLQVQTIKLLRSVPGKSFSAEQIASTIGLPDQTETIFKICEHLAANPDRQVRKTPGASPFEAKYGISQSA